MRKKFMAGLFFSMTLVVSGCGGPSQLSQPASNLTPAQANGLLRGNDPPQLVDVRNPDEYQPEHIAGAKLIPLPELETRLAEIDKEKPVLLYCLGGVRSQKAMDLLSRHGFKKLSQIAGGIKAWKQAGLPTTAAQPSPVSLPR